MRMRNSLTGTAALTLLIAAAVTPTAASAETTNATFTLTGGTITLTAPGSAALAGGDTGDAAVSGSLGAMTVTDDRGSTQGWSVTAQSSAFEEATSATPVPATDVAYATGTATPTGDVTLTEADNADMSVAATVVTAADAVGNNTATWSPTLAVTLPSNALAGDYEGTVTTSLL